MESFVPSNSAGSDEKTLRMRVEGMDCSACAIKAENALKRLPGVSDEPTRTPG